MDLPAPRTLDVVAGMGKLLRHAGSILPQNIGIYSYNSVLSLLASKVKGNKATTAFDDIFSGP